MRKISERRTIQQRSPSRTKTCSRRRGSGAKAREGGGEALGRDGLEEVVERVHFEGAEGVLVVGSGEDDLGDDFQALEQLEAGHAGHLDVEKEEVGREGVDEGEGFFA